MTSRRTAFAVALTACVAVSACGKEQQVTVDTGGGVTPAQSISAGRAYTLDGAGAELTDDQARNALLAQEDLPEGEWATGEQEKDPDGAGLATGLEPAACAGWFRAKVDTSHERTKQRVRYLPKAGTADGYMQIAATVVSFDEAQNAQANLQHQREALEKCATFTRTVKGEKIAGSFHPIDFDRPGDDSVATRLQLDTSQKGSTGTSRTVQHAVRVQVGHNVVTLSIISDKEIGADDLKKLVDKAFRRLEAATKH